MMITLYQNEQMQWCRKCSCGREIIYANKRATDAAVCYLRHSNKNTCHSCRQVGEMNGRFGKPISEKNRIAISIRNKGNTYSVGYKHSEDAKKKMSAGLMGNKHTLGFRPSEETRKKLRNKVVSEFTREKLREHRLNQIDALGYRGPAYNRTACQFIDRINNALGLNLQHALNGGEIRATGYSMDGYDKDKNIVFEYDEKTHRTPGYRQKDFRRQSRIISKITPCLFLRYDEINERLYDAETNSTIQFYANP